MRSCIPCGMLFAGAGFGFRYPPITGRAYLAFFANRYRFNSSTPAFNPPRSGTGWPAPITRNTLFGTPLGAPSSASCGATNVALDGNVWREQLNQPARHGHGRFAHRYRADAAVGGEVEE